MIHTTKVSDILAIVESPDEHRDVGELDVIEGLVSPRHILPL
jgi:hypothetical protein